MQNTNQSSQQPGSQSPPEFRPVLEGRLFTAHDATVGADCKVHPTARLLYDSLPPGYQEVFKNCPMYLEKHMEFVKFLAAMSKIDVRQGDANPELLRPLGIQIPTEEGDKKKWQCGVVGCNFKGTLQHLYTHLQQKKHIDLAMFSCQHCQRPFNRAHDRKRHEQTQHGNTRRPQPGLVRPYKRISHTAAIQIPTSRTRAAKALKRSEKQPPAYTDPVYSEDMSAGSDSPSSSEGDDQYSARGNSGGPASLADFGSFHHSDANGPHPQAFVAPFDFEVPSQLNQNTFESSPARPPVVTSPTVEYMQGYGYAGGPYSVTYRGYNQTPAPHPRPQARDQPFFSLLDQQTTRPALSLNNLMLPLASSGNLYQGSAAPPVTPIQSTNNGGMHAQIINNNYHVHSPAKPPQWTGNNLDTQPPPHMQWPTDMNYSPTYSQPHYLQIPRQLQTAIYATPSSYAPSGGYFYPDCYPHGSTNDTTHGLQQYPAYTNTAMGYGTSINVPCTWTSSGLRPVALRLHSVVEADIFKNRSLDNSSRLLYDHCNSPGESAMSPSGQQNASSYGEKQANGYRISIPCLRSFMLPNPSPYSSNVVNDPEKGVATRIDQRFPPAISGVRGIKLLIICCLVVMLLLSVGTVHVLYPEWQFGRFPFMV